MPGQIGIQEFECPEGLTSGLWESRGQGRI